MTKIKRERENLLTWASSCDMSTASCPPTKLKERNSDEKKKKKGERENKGETDGRTGGFTSRLVSSSGPFGSHDQSQCDGLALMLSD